jgi:uridine phosphorylase
MKSSVIAAGALALTPAAVVNAASCYSAGFEKTRFPNCAQLSASVALHWSLSSDNSSMTMGIVADTQGWAAIGFR